MAVYLNIWCYISSIFNVWCCSWNISQINIILSVDVIWLHSAKCDTVILLEFRTSLVWCIAIAPSVVQCLYIQSKEKAWKRERGMIPTYIILRVDMIWLHSAKCVNPSWNQNKHCLIYCNSPLCCSVLVFLKWRESFEKGEGDDTVEGIKGISNIIGENFQLNWPKVDLNN